MLKHSEITSEIVEGFYHVYNTLGYGFLEKVYENALVLELRGRGLRVQQQAPIKVHFNGEVVGDYFADLMVAGCIIVELKAVEAITEDHLMQLTNYLKATEIQVGLLLNFGPKPQVKRRIFD